VDLERGDDVAAKKAKRPHEERTNDGREDDVSRRLRASNLEHKRDRGKHDEHQRQLATSPCQQSSHGDASSNCLLDRLRE